MKQQKICFHVVSNPNYSNAFWDCDPLGLAKIKTWLPLRQTGESETSQNLLRDFSPRRRDRNEGTLLTVSFLLQNELLHQYPRAYYQREPAKAFLEFLLTNLSGEDVADKRTCNS